jgi:Mg-chelatase subunit ChlI
MVLGFDAAALLDRFAADVSVSPINSGNARRKAVRRGRQTFVP